MEAAIRAGVAAVGQVVVRQKLVFVQLGDTYDVFICDFVMRQKDNFHSAHPTGWAESISGNGVCMYVCMSVITSKMINMTARRLHRPL